MDHEASDAAPIRRYSPDLLPGLAGLVDLLGLSGLQALWAALAGEGAAIAATGGPAGSPAATAVVFLALCALGCVSGLYELDALRRPARRLGALAVSVAGAFAAFVALAAAFDRLDGLSVAALAAQAAAAFAVLAALRAAAGWALRRLERAGRIGRSVAVLGAEAQAARAVEALRAADAPFLMLFGVFTIEPRRAGPVGPATLAGAPALGDLDDLVALVRRDRIDDVVLAAPLGEDDDAEVMERLRSLPVGVHVALGAAGPRPRRATSGLAGAPVVEVCARPIAGWGYVAKRTMDVGLTVCGLILLLPLLLAIAVMIKADSPGPVLFRQQRLGLNNRPFMIYKFRSMYHRAAPEIRVVQARRGDPRVTHVGRLLRATSLDELPQLLNVLKGDMSLVGPRPHAMSHNEEYGALIRGYFARHRVKPGITGLAQIKGLRGETSDPALMEARVRYDVLYADLWSVLLDLRILVTTALVVAFQRSAY